MSFFRRFTAAKRFFYCVIIFHETSYLLMAKFTPDVNNYLYFTWSYEIAFHGLFGCGIYFVQYGLMQVCKTSFLSFCAFFFFCLFYIEFSVIS